MPFQSERLAPWRLYRSIAWGADEIDAWTDLTEAKMGDIVLSVIVWLARARTKKKAQGVERLPSASKSLSEPFVFMSETRLSLGAV